MSNFNDYFRNTGMKIIVDRFFGTADSYNPDYKITKLDNKYKKNNDKFGSYYIIDTEGLKIYDKDGYIRTARKK